MRIAYQIYDLHVTDVITWRLYHLHNFNFRVWYNTLPNRYCEHEVLSALSKFSLAIFCSDIIFTFLFLRISVDIAFLWTLPFCLFQVLAFLNCAFDLLRWSPTANSNLQFRLWSWTGTVICNLHPHLSVEIVKFFTTVKLSLNNVRYKMPQFWHFYVIKIHKN